jgi:hypothetical protein
MKAFLFGMLFGGAGLYAILILKWLWERYLNKQRRKSCEKKDESGNNKG